jgi:hypothetical protein
VRSAWLARVRIACSQLGEDTGWVGAALRSARHEPGTDASAVRARAAAGAGLRKA